MLTQCPNCQTTFRVTSEILRVAHGQVRCGRCQTQFDALERLIEETDAGEVESGRYLRPPRSSQPAARSDQPAPESNAIEVEESETQEDITLEGRHIEITGTYRVLDESGRGEPQVRQEITEEWVEIDAVDDAIATDDEAIDVREEFDATPDIDAQPASPDIERNPHEETEANAAPLRVYRTHTEPAVADLDLFSPQPRRAAAAPAWKMLAVPLVLLMVVQLVHNCRSTLARHPQLGAPLIGIYRGVGLPLTPDWNLHAYEIRQWVVAADPATPGTLKVRASIKNLGEFAQPYPLLKLVLEDRWGEQVRAREFEPAEYLDPTTSPDRLLGPAQQANATIAIVDPGPDAEGFRFDVCLRGSNGLVCAAEVGER